ncbi:hypothetical protein [Thalassobius sp. Cn5-15]|uniref:hypothetical protein n=1 Tax=Thalassobius sp. Cn5-15 TaxID=2917763 RepID=UPI001EF21448|nr:hypothetical protein [Thalassobius sp. Cn5-15]MCG7495227.1 hypothetical protein [Thalassobius sp. Cn5-15]
MLKFLAMFGCVACLSTQLSAQSVQQNGTGNVVGNNNNVTINTRISNSDRTFLFKENIELFWNEWWGTLVGEKSTGTLTLVIEGEGKTVQLIGILYMNCSNGKASWELIKNWANGDPNDPNAVNEVPTEVYSNANLVFCHR